MNVLLDGLMYLLVSRKAPYYTGPLLFLVYINDISEGLSTNCRLFADDCTLFGEVNSQSDALTLQIDMDLVVSWQLLPNASKYKTISISNHNIEV